MHAVALAAAPPSGLYTGPATAALAGITYRQLDHWARAGLIAPAIDGRPLRLWSLQHVVAFRACARLAEMGAGVARMRPLARAVLDLDLSTLPVVAAVNVAGEVRFGPLELDTIRSSWLVLVDVPPEVTG